MSSLHILYSTLYTRVVEDDENSQRYYLGMVEKQRDISVDYLLGLGALFIPNNDYIRHYLGEEAEKVNAGLYYNGVCPWVMYVVVPIRNLAGEIVGISGWDAYNKYRTMTEEVTGLSFYKVSAKSVFERNKYFLADISCLHRHFGKRIVFITDGMFDAISMGYHDLPAIALLGSTFSQEILYFLSWYKFLFVCADNDEAGVALVNKLSRALPNVYRVKQSKTKDIEELLRGNSGRYVQKLQQLRDYPRRGDFSLDEYTGRRFRS